MDLPLGAALDLAHQLEAVLAWQLHVDEHRSGASCSNRSMPSGPDDAATVS